jgi:hypothetical protein
MPVTYAVNRNIVGNAILGSNVAAPQGSTVNFAVADNQSNIFIGGTFINGPASSTAVFLPPATINGPATASTSNTMSTATPLAVGASSGFIAKYSSSGALYWSIGMGSSTSNVIVNSGSLDPTNYSNIYIGVTYSGASSPAVTLNNGTLTGGSVSSGVTLPAVSGSVTAGALIKVSTSGVVQWASALDNTVTNETGVAVVVDPAGFPYITTTYSNTAAFAILNGVTGAPPSGSTVSLPGVPTSSYTAMALVKYSSAGIAQWSTAIVPNTTAETLVSGSAIAADAFSNVYISGSYTDASSGVVPVFYNATSAGGTGTGFNLPVTSGVTNTGFLLKFNNAGTLQWGSTINNTVASSVSSINGVTVSGYNTVYVCGNVASTSATTIWNGNGGTSAPSSGTITIPAQAAVGTPNAFAAKYYGSNGTCQWTTSIPTSGLSSFNSCAVDPSDANLYLTGRYTASATTNIINSSGGTTSTIPAAANGAGLLVRNFIGGALACTTQPFSSASAIGNIGLTNVSIDPSVTNVYLGGTYYSTTGTSSLYNSTPTGGQGGTIGITFPTTFASSNAFGFFAKFG